MAAESTVLRLEPVRQALAELRDTDAVARLRARDAALFSRDPAVQETVSQRLGWLDVAGGLPGWREDLRALREEVAGAGLSRVLLAGMGGSSLAPEVFATVFGGRVAGAQLGILDSTHPVAVRRALDDTDLAAALVMVSSKSGTTEETRSFGAHAARLVPSPAHLAAITDGGSALEAEAREQGYRAVLTNPADIGGRYSALSLFGMAPAALAGVDIDTVWARGVAMLESCGPTVAAEDNPAAQLAAFLAGLARAGRDKLTLLPSPVLAPLGDWIEQLVAESTGKDGMGIIPVVGEPVGPPEMYGSDRAFVALRFAGTEPEGAGALAAAGHPVLVLDVEDRHDLGGEFVRWETATALVGVLLGVNPFDEPNVTESKRNTVAVLDEVAAGGALPEPEQGDLAELLQALGAGDYFSVQAYLPPDTGYEAAISRLRTVVRDRYAVATTAGWGPRFLHSTGQLHKGGPDRVVALQLVDSPPAGDPIPGRPYDFATLIRAQAAGDLRSLRAHGRRVAQIAVEGPADVERLADQASASG